MSDPSGMTNGDWDLEDEEEPSGLYVDDDDQADEAQEEKFLETVEVTFTCYPCHFRLMAPNCPETFAVANLHKDCTFDEPLLKSRYREES